MPPKIPHRFNDEKQQNIRRGIIGFVQFGKRFGNLICIAHIVHGIFLCLLFGVTRLFKSFLF